MKWVPENLKGIIGLLTVTFVFSYLFGITFFEIKCDKEIVLTCIVAIVAFGKDIYNYFFGNTQGANKKDELLANRNSLPIATTNSGDVNLSAKPKEEEITN